MNQFDLLINDFTTSYIFEFGARKFDKIQKVVDSSRKLTKTIDSFSTGPIPKDAIIYSIMSLPFFMFGKKETVMIGALLLLKKWHTLYNQDFTLYIELDLLAISDMIFKEAKAL